MPISNKILRKFGFKNDREGIIQRYIREYDNWKTHIEKSKQFIIQSAQSKNKNTCVVIGSGWWLDVPVDELCLIFDKVILVDITHSSQIRHKSKKFINLELKDIDVTGVINAIYTNRKLLKAKKLELIDLIPENYNFGLPLNFSPDMYVSINILSQISGFITSFLKNNNIENDNNKLLEFSKALEYSHIQMLTKEKSCLIVDYFENEYSKTDLPLSSKNRINIKLPKSKFAEKWKWKFDMNGNFKLNTKLIFKVSALDF